MFVFSGKIKRNHVVHLHPGIGELQQSVADELFCLFLDVHEMFPFASMCGI